ncbi:hypothetical protein MBLNU230_g6825t1 [Neophaeotheca triangularis]
MADSNGYVYNNQLVRFFFALHQLHNAEYGPEDAFELYHQAQEHQSAISSLAGGPALPALGHALAGSVATATSKLLTYPLDLVVTRLQVQRQLRGPREAASAAQDADAEYNNLVDAAQKIFQNEGGFRAFFTGCLPDVGKSIADSFLFFLAYTFIRQYELRKRGANAKSLPVITELGVGVAAGSFAKLLTTPAQNIIVRQQTAALVAARDPTSTLSPGESDKQSIKDIALQIHSERGLPGFWAGYSASTLLTLNPAITFAVDNLIRRLLLPRSQRENPSSRLTFLIAALSKTIATSLTYPINLAKTRAQVSSTANPSASSPDEKPTQAQTPLLRRLLTLLSAQAAILHSLRRIHATEGTAGLYSGLEGEVLKGFVSHGLTMVMKERVHVGVIRVYYLLLKLTRRWPEELRKVEEGVRDAAGEGWERVGVAAEGARGRVGVVAEGARESFGVAAEGAREKVGEVGERAVEGGRSVMVNGRMVVEEAGERFMEGGKSVVEEGRKTIGGE